MCRALQLGKQLLGTIEQAGLEIILCQFIERIEFLRIRQIFALDQVLVHANGTFNLAAPPEQRTQRKMQLDGLRLDLDDLDERFNGLVWLLIEQEIEAFEIGTRQRARFGQQMLDVDARSQPAQRKKQRQCQQPPVFNFHVVPQCLSD